MKFYTLLVLLLCSNAIALEHTVAPGLSTHSINSSHGLTPSLQWKPSSDLMNCSPSLTGLIQIPTTKSLLFLPDKPLRAGQRHLCQVNSKGFSLSVAPLKLERTVLERHKLNTDLRLQFNEEVSKVQLEKSLALFEQLNSSESPLDYNIQGEESGRFFLLRTNRAIHPNSSIRLKIKELNTESSQIQFLDQIVSESHQRMKGSKLILVESPIVQAIENGQFKIRIFLPQEFRSVNGRNRISLKSQEQEIPFQILRSAYNYRSWDSKIKSDYYLDLAIDVEPDTKLELTLHQGFSAGEFALERDQKFSLKVPDRKAFGRILAQGKYLYLQKPTIDFEASNLSSIQLILSRLSDQNLRYFMQFEKGKERTVNKMAQELFQKTIPWTTERNKIGKFAIHLDDMMPWRKPGVYQIQILEGSKLLARKVFFLSDLGIQFIQSKSGITVWVNNLSKASAIEGAKVQIFSQRNELIGQGQSSAEGLFQVELTDPGADKPAGVLVSTAHDENFLILDKPLQGTQSPYPHFSNSTKAYLGLPRSLLRPGESMKILALLRSQSTVDLEGVQSQLEMRGPNGRLLNSYQCQMNSLFACLFDVKTYYQDRTGSYDLRLKMGSRTLASKSLQLGSFLTPRIKPELIVPSSIQSSGRTVVLSAQCRNYFGAPCKESRAGLSIHSSRDALQLGEFAGFSFTATHPEANTNLSDFRWETQTLLDESGEAKLPVPLSWNGSYPQVLRLHCRLSVNDQGREVETRKSFLYSPAPRVVGIKPVFNGTPSSGDTLEFKSVLLDIDSLSTLQSELTAQLIRSQWQWAFDQGAGEARWQQMEELVEERRVNSSESFRFTVKRSGDYKVRLVDPVYNHRAQHSFWVSGWDMQELSPNNEMEKLDIRIENQSVKPGDIASLHIKSPIAGKMLVSLHSNSTLLRRVYNLENRSATVELEIPHNLDARELGYLTAQASVIRPQGTGREVLPIRAWGQVEIPLDQSEKLLKMELQAPERVNSNQSVEVKVTLFDNKDTQLFLYAVDQSLLDLNSHQMDNPFEVLKNNQGARVGLYDLYSQIQESAGFLNRLSFGSDGSSSAKANKHKASRILSKRVKPFFYTSNLLEPDSNGQVHWKFNSMQFQGKVKVVALAYSSQKYAMKTTNTVVADPVVIKASFPRFLHKSDRLLVPVELHNTTNIPQNVQLKTETDPGIEVQWNENNFRIQGLDSLKTRFWMEAHETGLKTITIQSSLGSASVSLPVLEPDHLSSLSYGGVLTTQASIQLPTEILANAKSIRLQLGSKNSALLSGVKDSLLRYPYGCAEQTATQLGALSLLAGNSKELGKSSTALAFFTMGKQRLLQMLQSTGQFRYWPNGKTVHEFASLFASSILLESSQKGLWEIGERKNSILRGIQRSLGSRNVLNALFAHYLLNKYKRGYRSELTQLQSLKCKTSLHWTLLAVNARLSSYEDLAGVALSSLSNSSLEVDKENFGSMLRDQSWQAYLRKKHFPEKFAAIEASRTCLNKLNRNQLYNTQEKYFCMKLLLDESQEGPLKVKIESLGLEIHEPASISLKPEQFPLILHNESGPSSWQIEAEAFLTPEQQTRLDLVGGEESQLKMSTLVMDLEGRPVSKLKHAQNYLLQVQLNSPVPSPDLALILRSSACAEVLPKEQSISILSRVQGKELYTDGINLQSWDERDDRQILFLDLLKDSKLYLGIRAIHKGKCQLPNSLVEAMYDSRVKSYDRYFQEVIVE